MSIVIGNISQPTDRRCHEPYNITADFANSNYYNSFTWQFMYTYMYMYMNTTCEVFYVYTCIDRNFLCYAAKFHTN